MSDYEKDMRAAILALMSAREALARAGEHAYTDEADRLLEEVSDRLNEAKQEVSNG